MAFCHLLLGQVIRNENGDLNDIQKEFVLSAELSDELALSATTKWWNASIKLTNDELGRKTLAKQAKQLINAIAKRPRAKGFLISYYAYTTVPFPLSRNFSR